MNPKEDFQPAYLIHTRPYRETSLLLEFFTANFGRVSAVAKGGRRSGKNRPTWQLFLPLQITWSGSSDLKSLRQIEITGPACQLSGAHIYSGMYLNELLYRLLDIHEPVVSLFAAYMQCLEVLSAQPSATQEQQVLRQFELQLLAALGYGVEFTVEADTGNPVRADRLYEFQLEKGFINHGGSAPSILGADLVALQQGGWQGQQLKYLKYINRQAIDHLLGHKPLHSRELYKTAVLKPDT